MRIVLWSAVLAVLLAPAAQAAEPAVDWEHAGTVAKMQCQKAVTRALKSPSTAVFQPINDMTIKPAKGGYAIHGYVDSQNGFGATVRSRFNCGAVKSEKWWTLKSVNM